MTLVSSLTTSLTEAQIEALAGNFPDTYRGPIDKIASLASALPLTSFDSAQPSELVTLIKKADIDIQNLKVIIFDGNILTSEKKTQKISKSILGISKVVLIDSVILSNIDLIKKLLFCFVKCMFPIFKYLICKLRFSSLYLYSYKKYNFI